MAWCEFWNILHASSTHAWTSVTLSISKNSSANSTQILACILKVVYMVQERLDDDKIPIDSEIVEAAPPYSDNLASIEAKTEALSIKFLNQYEFKISSTCNINRSITQWHIWWRRNTQRGWKNRSHCSKCIFTRHLDRTLKFFQKSNFLVTNVWTCLVPVPATESVPLTDESNPFCWVWVIVSSSWKNSL